MFVTIHEVKENVKLNFLDSKVIKKQSTIERSRNVG